MEKITVVDRVTPVMGSLIIEVRLQKKLVDDDGMEWYPVKDGQYHRTVIEPGVSVDDQFALVNTHLEQMGMGKIVENDDAKALRDMVALLHSPAVVQRYRTEIAKRQEKAARGE